jgi:hypothetical protein
MRMVFGVLAVQPGVEVLGRAGVITHEAKPSVFYRRKLLHTALRHVYDLVLGHPRHCVRSSSGVSI